MPQAIKFTPETKMLVAVKTEQDIRDVQAQLEIAMESAAFYGDAYYVFDYSNSEGYVPHALMHERYFNEHFEMLSPEFEKRFVPVKVVKTPS